MSDSEQIDQELVADDAVTDGVADAGPAIDRRAGSERRGGDRRQKSATDANYPGPERRAADRRNGSTLERRRGPGRRRTDDRRSAEEGEMTPEQFEFVMAVEAYKKLNKRMFPTWTEILEVFDQLGYRKVEHRSIKLQDVPEPALMDIADIEQDEKAA